MDTTKEKRDNDDGKDPSRRIVKVPKDPKQEKKKRLQRSGDNREAKAFVKQESDSDMSDAGSEDEQLISAVAKMIEHREVPRSCRAEGQGEGEPDSGSA